MECPFHGWTFQGEDGKCVRIPYAKGKVPEVAKTKPYIVQEVSHTSTRVYTEHIASYSPTRVYILS